MSVNMSVNINPKLFIFKFYADIIIPMDFNINPILYDNKSRE